MTPLLAAVACACAAFASLPAVTLTMVAGMGWHGIPLAAASTSLCLVLAVPVALNSPGPTWLLPAWLAGSVGAVGTSLLVLPQTSLVLAVQVAAVLLPFMVAGLAEAFPGTLGLRRAAAAAGAGPIVTARLLAPVLWPGVLRASLMVLLFGVACLASGSWGVRLAWPTATP